MFNSKLATCLPATHLLTLRICATTNTTLGTVPIQERKDRQDKGSRFTTMETIQTFNDYFAGYYFGSLKGSHSCFKRFFF